MSANNNPEFVAPMDLDSWMEVTSKPLDLAQMDAEVRKMQELWTEVEAREAAAKEARKIYDEQENKVLAALQAAGKTKYNVEGLGTVYVTNKLVYRVPKDITSKQALFDYIERTQGSDVLFNLLSINHQTINSFANREAERARERGEAVLNIPGLEAPTAHESVGFRTERKK